MKLEEQIKRMKQLMENDDQEDEYQPDADDYFQDMYMSLKYMKLPADVRLHITQRGIPAKRNIIQKSAEQKPSGLWYGVGLEWPKFVEEEQLGIYGAHQFYVYEFDISKDNIKNFDKNILKSKNKIMSLNNPEEESFKEKYLKYKIKYKNLFYYNIICIKYYYI